MNTPFPLPGPDDVPMPGDDDIVYDGFYESKNKTMGEIVDYLVAESLRRLAEHHALAVGPDEVLVLSLPKERSPRTLDTMCEELTKHLGDRWLVIGGDGVQITKATREKT